MRRETCSAPPSSSCVHDVRPEPPRLRKVAQASLCSRHVGAARRGPAGVGGSEAVCGIARVAEAAIKVLESSLASRDALRTAFADSCRPSHAQLSGVATAEVLRPLRGSG